MIRGLIFRTFSPAERRRVRSVNILFSCCVRDSLIPRWLPLLLLPRRGSFFQDFPEGFAQ